MHTNLNLAAPIALLALLAVCGLIFVSAIALVFSILQRRFVVARAALVAIAATGVMYIGLVMFFSLRSNDRLLERGEEKYFCEMDCHLAYSITDVREQKTLEDKFNSADSTNRVAANGSFWLVTIQTRFDEKTTSPARGDAPLRPNSRDVYVEDKHGKRYSPSSEAQHMLVRLDHSGTPMSTPLRPGESYTTTFVFDLPIDVSDPALLIQETNPITRLVIGHENSFFHKKIRFQL